MIIALLFPGVETIYYVNSIDTVTLSDRCLHAIDEGYKLANGGFQSEICRNNTFRIERLAISGQRAFEYIERFYRCLEKLTQTNRFIQWERYLTLVPINFKNGKLEKFTDAMHLLASSNLFTENAWQHIYYNSNIHVMVCGLADIDCFTPETWMSLRQQVNLPKAARILSLHEIFTAESWKLLENNEEIQYAVCILDKIRAFNVDAWDILKDNTELQEAIRAVGPINSFNADDWDALKVIYQKAGQPAENTPGTLAAYEKLLKQCQSMAAPRTVADTEQYQQTTQQEPLWELPASTPKVSAHVA